MTAVDLAAERRPWGPAIVWLCFLTPLFFITYLGSLEIVSWRDHVPVILFDWERHIPFLAWTVVPYWSIDALYGLSLFICLTRDELSRHARRLLSAQMIAVPIFLIAPLKLTSTIPADTGIFAFFFGALDDIVGKPFNMAPSLHIALLITLWVRYAHHVPRRWHWPMHVWAMLIGISVLTANQHHFFDVPTGMMLGFFCLWLWPERGASPLAALRLTNDPKRRRLGALYGAAASALVVAAWQLGGTALWLLWPAQSLLLVALGYAAIGPALFQKDEAGRMSLAAQWLLWPYLLGARLNAWLWTRRLPEHVRVLDPVSVGRLPRAAGAPNNRHVIDVCAELPAPDGDKRWTSLPMLDLITPSPAALCEVARKIDRAARDSETVLVCCALGFSRSAASVVTWLAAFGHVEHVDDAIDLLRSKRPEIVLNAPDLVAINSAVDAIRKERA